MDDGEALEATHQHRSRCCFQEWMQLQRQDLTLLLESIHNTHNDDQSRTLIRNCLAHFEDYITNRRRFAEEDAFPFFAPTWCTSLENSLLWIAGCRPSIFIRLLYALSGCEVDARLGEWLEGIRGESGNHHLHVGNLSASQLVRVNGLHMRTVRAEERQGREMASCQEEPADEPIAVIVNEMEGVVGEEVGEAAERALKEHEREMRRMMEKADELRLKTIKEVMEILEPVQAVEFLVASKKLHLSLHQWGKRRDERHGRRC
ncbi:protein DOG1-like 1 [Cucurbita moschata]|uniref:Protein DOG1-like 1 n=1 Tax=Cucurbita moschata TaxID=3662 RepID=A0A6J1GT06_CUCMO|nr:protein DOG1-like 1 [Cucurbita moschata]